MADHTGFIVAAYAVTGVVLLGMVAAVLADHRALRRTLASLSGRLDRRDGPARAMEGNGDDEP
jgi:heme exporter protein CcmD